jgi:hypothetical protein
MPKIPPIVVPAWATACGTTPVAQEDMRIDGAGGVQDAFVRLERGTAKPAASDVPLARLVAKACNWSPHAQVITTLQSLELANEMTVLTNAHAYDETSAETIFNVALPRATSMQRGPFAAEQILVVGDDVFPWMRAVVLVAGDSRATITDAHGEFVFDDVAPGEHDVDAWHDGAAFGHRARHVVLPADGSEVHVELVYSAP